MTSIKLNFFPHVQILIFLGQATQGNILDNCISLDSVQYFLVVLGVVGMCQLLLISQLYIYILKSIFLLF